MPQTLSYQSLSAAPRERSRRVRSRAWAELPVQIWWKSAIAVAAIALIISAVSIKDERRHRTLMREGLPIEALIVEVKSTSRPSFSAQREENIPVKLRWRLPGQEDETIDTFLPTGPGYAKVGETVQVRVDPNDHKNWVEEAEVRPWWWVLFIPLFLLVPTILLLLLIAWWRHRQVLRLWLEGKRSEGVVVDARHAA